MCHFQVVWIGQDEEGLTDIRDLEDKLKVQKYVPVLIQFYSYANLPASTQVSIAKMFSLTLITTISEREYRYIV